MPVTGCETEPCFMLKDRCLNVQSVEPGRYCDLRYRLHSTCQNVYFLAFFLERKGQEELESFFPKCSDFIFEKVNARSF